jgi:hypothetical protein
MAPVRRVRANLFLWDWPFWLLAPGARSISRRCAKGDVPYACQHATNSCPDRVPGSGKHWLLALGNESPLQRLKEQRSSPRSAKNRELLGSEGCSQLS